MKHLRHILPAALTCLLLSAMPVLPVSAEEADAAEITEAILTEAETAETEVAEATEAEAEITEHALTAAPAEGDAAAVEYTKTAVLTASNGAALARIRDGSESSYVTLPAGSTINISCSAPIAGIYIKFEKKAPNWYAFTASDNVPLGKYGFLHEYADVSQLGSAEIKLCFETAATVTEIRIFGSGILPSDVQVWQPPCEKADIALFTTHSDDEQLFFLGLIPTMAAAGKKLQVIYFVHHNGEPIRLHEQLNGLWAAGQRYYPEIGIFPDQYSTTLAAAKSNLSSAGFSYDRVMQQQVAMLRKYKPDVVICHDVNGEYGHGQHRLNSETLRTAVTLSGDAEKYPDSAAQYGVWDPPKTYVHLWNQNQLVMDYDTPLDYFGGKTAYEMSRAGYSCHNSQQYTWFTRWGYGNYTKASQITSYSPCKFGLFRTTVGADTGINDMFEHIGTPPLLRGDVSGDGEIGPEDAQTAMMAYTQSLSGGNIGLSDAQFAAADINGDGAVGSDDAQNILQYYVQHVMAELPVTWEQLLSEAAKAEET